MAKTPATEFDEDVAAAPPTLKELRAELADTKDYIEKEFANSPALSFVKQKLTEAVTGIDQELRNIIIDAQMEAKKLEHEAAQRARGLL